MSEEQPPGEATRAFGTYSGDIGRRIAFRRAQLGLSVEDVAARAGAAPEYLRYVEGSAAAPTTGLLLKVAAALDTTVSQLSGGTAERPEGPGQAAGHAELLELTREECFSLLSTHGIGRIGGVTHDGPVIVPVNYTAVGSAIVFRTASGTVAAAVTAAPEVAFEVDRIDEAFSRGWSVLVIGPGRQVTDAEELKRLTRASRSEPWAGGRRDLWVSIEPRRVTGRRIVTD